MLVSNIPNISDAYGKDNTVAVRNGYFYRLWLSWQPATLRHSIGTLHVWELEILHDEQCQSTVQVLHLSLNNWFPSGQHTSFNRKIKVIKHGRNRWETNNRNTVHVPSHLHHHVLLLLQIATNSTSCHSRLFFVSTLKILIVQQQVMTAMHFEKLQFHRHTSHFKKCHLPSSAFVQ